MSQMRPTKKNPIILVMNQGQLVCILPVWVGCCVVQIFYVGVMLADDDWPYDVDGGLFISQCGMMCISEEVIISQTLCVYTSCVKQNTIFIMYHSV